MSSDSANDSAKSDGIDADGGVDITPAKDHGVIKSIIKEGQGTELPSPGCKVTVHYTGTFEDGKKFDSSKDRNSPFEFDLGKGSVIKAWDIAVATMKIGEVCIITCAPEYAYGKNGSGSIPPDTILLFEIEMISWEGEDLSPKKNKGILRYNVTEGTGSDNPTEGAYVDVEYVGRLPGTEIPFETKSLQFNLGEGSEVGVCDGIEKGLEKFKSGETSRLIIQPKYAFKSEGNKDLGVPANSVVEYTVTLKSFEKAKDSWSLDSDERTVQAKIFKEKGTNYFKAAKYALAIRMYKKTVEFLISDFGYEGEGLKERNEILLSAYLNLSICYLKCKPILPLESKENAQKALDLDPKNVKGLFRKGQALQEIGDLERAVLAFQKVIEVEPENKAAANQISICKSEIRKQAEKEKKIYVNMFEKFAQRDRETEQLSAKGMPDVMGEPLGEWGVGGAGEWLHSDRNREPTEFEKENPNILMLDKDGQFQNM